jgi:hypothetical protein
MKKRTIVIALAAAGVLIALVAVLAWSVPLIGSSAISMAKASEAFQSPGSNYAQLVGQYEAAVGSKGSWKAERTNGDHYSWDVTYTHPGLSTLWFGVQTRWSIYMNDVTPEITQRMLEVIQNKARVN